MNFTNNWKHNFDINETKSIEKSLILRLTDKKLLVYDTGEGFFNLREKKNHLH